MSSKVKIVSLKKLQENLKTEKDLGKREQLRLIIDEMGEVYPDESEIPDDPRTIFTTPKQWKSSNIKRKLVMGMLGESFTGKTFSACSSSHLTTKHIKNDFKGLTDEQMEYFLQGLKRYIPFTPVWVIGTEESTYECLTSDDNAEYFEHANINYIEVLSKGSGLTLLDQIRTYKNFLIAIYALSNLKRGTVILDSSSGILTAQHEIVRRVIGKLPSLAKSQGILPRHWFWRNVEREGIMYWGRIMPVHFIFTIKIIMQSKENEKDFEKIKWWEETDRHLSSVIMKNTRIGKQANFNSTIEKCRINTTLYNKTYKNLTMPLFMWNLINAKKRKIKEEI